MKISDYDKSVYKMVGAIALALCILVGLIALIVGSGGESGDLEMVLERPIGEQKTWVVLVVIWIVCYIGR